MKYDNFYLLFLKMHYRGKNTTQNGFGIGLSVAKTILENHSGKIKLYMNNDKFCIRIKL